jgi:hypothetical protein
LLFNCALEYAIGHVQANQQRKKFNVSHQLVAYAAAADDDDDNLLGRNINTINKSTEALLVISQEFDLEVNAEKTKYMFTFYEHNEGRN